MLAPNAELRFRLRRVSWKKMLGKGFQWNLFLNDYTWGVGREARKRFTPDDH